MCPNAHLLNSKAQGQSLTELAVVVVILIGFITGATALIVNSSVLTLQTQKLNLICYQSALLACVLAESGQSTTQINSNVKAFVNSQCSGSGFTLGGGSKPSATVAVTSVTDTSSGQTLNGYTVAVSAVSTPLFLHKFGLSEGINSSSTAFQLAAAPPGSSAPLSFNFDSVLYEGVGSNSSPNGITGSILIPAITNFSPNPGLPASTAVPTGGGLPIFSLNSAFGINVPTSAGFSVNGGTVPNP